MNEIRELAKKSVAIGLLSLIPLAVLIFSDEIGRLIFQLPDGSIVNPIVRFGSLNGGRIFLYIVLVLLAAGLLALATYFIGEELDGLSIWCAIGSLVFYFISSAVLGAGFLRINVGLFGHVIGFRPGSPMTVVSVVSWIYAIVTVILIVIAGYGIYNAKKNVPKNDVNENNES